MCGIFGWVKFEEPFTEKEVKAARGAVASMFHRGPDFGGEWIIDCLYMGHRRLSIIDLSSEANQPFIDKEGRFYLIFNGEIYNYLELRQELMKEGVVFYTSSDTEVLLAAFKVWRTEAFLKLEGMFAGAVYDSILRRHYLFRDPLGQKPLYYYRYKSGIIYASELRALLSLSCFNWHLDRESFLKFLTNSYYIWDTSPLKGVKKLLPGCYLETNIYDRKTVIQRFWNSLPGENCSGIDFSEALLEFQRLIDRSCEISLRADVPCGIFLSGGIDSSIILSSCSKKNPNISSFVLSIDEQDFDELFKSALVVKHLKIKKNRFYKMDFLAIRESIDSFLSFSDEPHGDPGFVNTYFLARVCRPEIAVALAGDGADELFGGYISFLALEKEKKIKNLPSYFLYGLDKIARHVLLAKDTYMGLQFKLLSFLQGFPAHETTRFPLWLSAISPEELKKLCPWQNYAFFSRMGEKETLFEDFREVLSVMQGKSRIQMLLYFYQKFFLPEFVCMHTDRAAMQNSLEVRSPFLSVPLIEYANNLPDGFKIRKGELKVILRHNIKKIGFPREIYKQKKQGFTFPVARWLKSALREKLCKALSKDKWNNELVDYKYMNFLKEQHFSGERNNYRILFNLMVFGEWLEKYPQVLVNS